MCLRSCGWAGLHWLAEARFLSSGLCTVYLSVPPGRCSLFSQPSVLLLQRRRCRVQDVRAAAEALVSERATAEEAWAHFWRCAWLSLATVSTYCCHASDFKEDAYRRTYSTFCFNPYSVLRDLESRNAHQGLPFSQGLQNPCIFLSSLERAEVMVTIFMGR